MNEQGDRRLSQMALTWAVIASEIIIIIM